MNDLMTKSFLSYVELKRQSQIDITSEEEDDIEKGMRVTPSDEAYLSGFFQEVDAIKSNMEEISSLLFDLRTLNDETKSTHSSKVLRGLRDRMDSDMGSVLRKANVVRTRLECLDISNRGTYNEGSAMDRTRVSVTHGLRIKLKEMMSDFQSLRDKIASDHHEYLKRWYYNITGEYPSEGTIETMVSGSGKVLEGFEKQREVIMENKDRHEAVMDIKRSLNKLHQVFLDMAVLVEEQGQDLNDIEGNVAKAGSFVSGGTDSLFYAKQMKDKKSRSWVCLMWAVVIIICLVCWIAMWSSF